MLIFGDQRFLQTPFASEAELEQVVAEHFEDIFGPSAIYLPKKLIKTRHGFGTIPDGIVVDLAARQWFLIEAELASHSVWNHIAPQVSKQVTALAQRASKQILIELAVDLARDDDEVMSKFADEDVDQLDVRRVLDEILNREPVVGIPIDAIPADLQEWAATLKFPVKLWIVRKLVQLSDPSVVIFEVPEEYEPSLDIHSDGDAATARSIARFDVGLPELIGAKLLTAGDVIRMSYAPRGGVRREFEATINANGALSVGQEKFPSLSAAAWHCMHLAGSNRPTVNGWDTWKMLDGRLVREVRDEYLRRSTSEATSD